MRLRDAATSTIAFPPFRLDLRAEQLRRGTTPVPLRPKTFAVLRYLAERPGALVTKQALLDAVWGDVAVSEDVARLSVGELRGALGDERSAPHFIETVPRRGYRFIAMLADAVTDSVTNVSEAAEGESFAVEGFMVGRTRENAEITTWFRAAANGGRQIGFVTGEAGIGKTTLVGATLRKLREIPGTPFRVARGQCIEHYGGGEPYLPILDALAGLCRGPDGEAVAASLLHHTPGWVARALGLSRPARGDRAEPAASTHESTLQRLALGLEAVADEIPLVFVLEDLHWSDYSTLDLLSVIARRRAPARMLVLCTLRPADAIARGHPVAHVKRELLRQGLCREIPLGGLSSADVAAYLEERFAGAELSADLLPLLVDRSEGNPFFIVALVDHLLEQRLLVMNGNRWELRGAYETMRTTVPDGLRAVIEPRLEKLTTGELRVLEAGSVIGTEFDAHAVARVAFRESDLADVEVVEQLCDALVRRQEILRAAGDGAWADGTTSARYAFGHAFYQQVIYQRLSPSTRRRLHQTIGEALEAAYVGRTPEVAAELAAHFKRARDFDRTVRYHREASAHAGSRFAYREARFHLEKALEAMRSQAETHERLRHEMAMTEDLGWTSIAIEGFGDSGAALAFARARDLAERLDCAPVRLRAMDALLTVNTMRAEYTTARVLGEELIALAGRLGDPSAVSNARPTLGAALMLLGELEAAHEQGERGRRDFGMETPTIYGVSSCLLLASTCAHLGQIARARAVNRDAVALAGRLGIPYLRAHATNFTATTCAVLRDVADTRSLAEETLRLATECGFSILEIMATMYLGWCAVQEGRVEEGLASVREAFDQYKKSSQRISTSSYGLLLVEAELASGDVAAAIEALDGAVAFAAETGERIYEHEIHRLKGECALAGALSGSRKAAVDHFERAIGIAAARKALLFELRAATSLCRIQRSARDRLAGVVDRFGAEDDCADLRAARSLL